ncbi:hypothetical protein WJX73_009197 [Symbiochloris irregularis]|uniref:3-beta hydroxysteroid dehydrogenase/isomerase domain-containing protein n=1 Tax=Symbiochloris irregularis TaxID=706552 RepID=A0AAW1NVJ1_9CHLO
MFRHGCGVPLRHCSAPAPYPAQPLDYYTKSKIMGEKLVLAANGTGKLATVALRPSYVYGEYDRLFIPLIIQKAREGKMKYHFGQGIMMPTYAGNAAQAHIQAAEALTLDSPLAGRPYFTTDSAPRPFWQFLGDVLQPLGYERPHIPLPGLLMWVLAWIFQYLIVPLLRPIVSLQATEFSPERIRIMLCKRILRIDNARRDFGYEPKISTDEGIRRTAHYFQHLRKA